MPFGRFRLRHEQPSANKVKCHTVLERSYIQTSRDSITAFGDTSHRYIWCRFCLSYRLEVESQALYRISHVALQETLNADCVLSCRVY